MRQFADRASALAAGLDLPPAGTGIVIAGTSFSDESKTHSRTTECASLRSAVISSPPKAPLLMVTNSQEFRMRVLIAVFIFLSTVWATTAHSEEFTEQQIRELVLDTIRANPEIIQEAITLLQQRQEERKNERIASILTENRELFERDPTAPVLGNPEGDVTLVEFFDYNCPYCKQVAGDVKSLIEKDGNIRLVYREWPILGEGSVFAARAALAARKQGKYEAMHWALMSLKRADERSVLQVASDLGLDIEKLQNDMQSSEIDEHIGISHELTQALGITGTPSFTIGDKAIFGAVPLTELENAVEEKRSKH